MVYEMLPARVETDCVILSPLDVLGMKRGWGDCSEDDRGQDLHIQTIVMRLWRIWDTFKQGYLVSRITKEACCQNKVCNES